MTWTLHEGEALAWLRGLPDGYADALVTDPPYSNTGNESSSVSVAARGGVVRELQFYEAWIREHLREWVRVLKPTGAIWFTVDWRGALACDQACARLGLKTPKIGIWHRGGLGMGFVLRNVYEPFCVIPMERWERRKMDEPDVWDCKWTPSDRSHEHSAEKPIALARRAIDLLTVPGALVLDPFTGSGTTGVAAIQSGRRFEGCEREPHYAEVARGRLTGASGGGVERRGQRDLFSAPLAAALLSLSLLCACPPPPAPADGGDALAQVDQAEPPPCPGSKRCGQNSDCLSLPTQTCVGGCCVSPFTSPKGAR